MMQIKGLKFILLTLIMIILSGCGNEEGENNLEVPENLLDNPYQKTEIVMGTPITIRIYDEGKEDLIEKSFEMLRGFEDIASVNIEGSEVDQINDYAGIKPVEVSEDIFTLVESGIHYGEETDGLFD